MNRQELLIQERTFLARCDRHVAEGEEHIAMLEAKIKRLHENGENTSRMEGTLHMFRVTMTQHHVHRATILQHIAVLERRDR